MTCLVSDELPTDNFLTRSLLMPGPVSYDLGIHNISYAFNDSCTASTDCSLSEKTICIDNICQCDTLSEYSDALGKCLSYATEYDTLCYEEWQCEEFIGANSQCSNNACLCKTGYRWYQGKCQKYAKKDEGCSDDLICMDESNPLALTCIKDTCQCSQGYYDRGGDCRVKSLEANPCAITSDCFPTKNLFNVWSYSHCELGKCIKNAVQVDQKEFNNTFRYSEQSSYLKMLTDQNLSDSTTESPVQKCPNGVSSDLLETDCLDCPNTIYFKQSSCICAQGFFLQDGQCIAELGMKDPNTQYATDEACPIKPGKAVDGVCYCRDYWFQDETNRECKKTTLEYTQTCLDNDWCKVLGPYAYCNSQTEKCNCSSQAVFNETSFYCNLNPDADVSKICLANSDCPLYETCRDESCHCDDGFYRVNETSLCLPQIGYSCEVRDCSHIDNAKCALDDICQCVNESYVSDGFVCLKATSALNEACEIKQQCQYIPHSDCKTSGNETSLCVCSDEYLDVDESCYAVKKPGSQCSTQFNCTVILGDTFECRNNLCQCPIGSTLTADAICVGGSSASRLSLYTSMPVLAVFVILGFKFA